MGQQRGAGQPLHRDLGYVSVNIMLNDHSEFHGGGTFFERQLLSLSSWNESYIETDPSRLVKPLKPLGAGHALAHFSSDRHAGAATTGGVRDILVLFIAAEVIQTGVDLFQRTPRWEQSARLKAAARSYCKQCFPSGDGVENTNGELICRVQHLRLAIDAVPNDGEAFHYLGMALSEFEDSSSLDLAIACLQEGVKYTPCDARLYNNIGLVWEKKLVQCNSNNVSKIHIIHDKIKSAYETAIGINSICTRIGCDVRIDFERACLNFGLYLSYQDDFQGAVDILERIQSNATDLITGGSETRSPERQRVNEDAHRWRGLVAKHRQVIQYHMYDNTCKTQIIQTASIILQLSNNHNNIRKIQDQYCNGRRGIRNECCQHEHQVSSGSLPPDKRSIISLLLPQQHESEPNDEWTMEELIHWSLAQYQAKTIQKCDLYIDGLRDHCNRECHDIMDLHKMALEAAQDNNENNATASSAPAAASTAADDQTKSPVKSTSRLDHIAVQITSGPHAPSKFQLRPKPDAPCFVGRSKGKKFIKNGISLHKDQEVSTTHAKIIVEGMGLSNHDVTCNNNNNAGEKIKFYFMDVGSTNGSTLNGEAVEPEPNKVLIEEGMEIKVGMHLGDAVYDKNSEVNNFKLRIHSNR
eukprot:scaffold7663_cov68-Cyclotella_meneghiniana.AAC.9